MKIRTALMRELTITKFSRLREVVDLNPPYQRESGVWGMDTRRVLIDSILNSLDLPKLYFEKLSTRRLTPEGLTYQYAVIDGKQRLETIISFLTGELQLADDFRFFEDESVKAGGMTLPILVEKYEQLVRRFLDYELPIVSVTTDSGDLIEEMFQRLNASSSLNAAERRNAVSGATRDAANSLADHKLLTQSSPIKNARYKYRELGAKFLAIEHQRDRNGRIVDTKANTLYSLFVATRGNSPSIARETMEQYRDAASATLGRMYPVFVETDPLLSSIGTLVVYYVVFRDLKPNVTIDRGKLQTFEELRRQASRMPEDDPDYARSANARLREYNVLVQSTNDGRAIERRAEILLAFLEDYAPTDPLAGLDRLSEGEIPEEEGPDV